MRILIISDIHANLTALEAVLFDAGKVEAVWCLGDLVGYGPDPNECVSKIKQLPGLVCLIGNHDAASVGRIDVDTFNNEARQALMWTQNVLDESSRDYLLGLPERSAQGDVTLTHGSPRQPIWEYLLDAHTATQNFSYFTTPFCFVGHSHLPLIFQMSNGNRRATLALPEPYTTVEMAPRAIFNPGSVGQPRDRDPRAAYAIFDNEKLTFEYRRVYYDIDLVQERMLAANLPERHIMRLKAGW